ncbi:MAG: hypothetical protein JRG91_03780 [Deltaproteobacteria bacterium]|nr:hypothetical protein [Deltaproteobacteria bacterium]
MNGAENRTLPAVLLIVLLGTGSCNGDKLTNVALEEYLVDVTCTADGGCTGPGGTPVEGTWVQSRAIASATASLFSPHGTYMYIDYMRGTTYVEIEMDFPTDVAGDVPLRAVMREYAGGEPTFESDTASGVIQVAPPGGSNRIPAAGGFNLKFVSHGPDGEPSTGDDEVREIRNGRFELDDQPAVGDTYDVSYPESAWDDPDFGVVIEIWVYPDGEYDDDYYEDDTYSSGGCTGDEYQDDTYDDTYDSGGCEGDTYDDTYDYTYDSGGCDSGDWTSSDTDSGGCEGDTYDDTSGDTGCDCEGDSALTASRPSRRTFALFVPVFAIFITRSLLRRRR